MGYESRVYVVERSIQTNWALRICMFDLCKMGSDSTFYGLFKNAVDYDVYLGEYGNGGSDGSTKVDAYGDPIKDAPIQAVIEWLEEEVKREDYRRLKPLLGLLKGFAKEQWENSRFDLRVIHYGY